MDRDNDSDDDVVSDADALGEALPDIVALWLAVILALCDGECDTVFDNDVLVVIEAECETLNEVLDETVVVFDFVAILVSVFEGDSDGEFVKVCVAVSDPVVDDDCDRLTDPLDEALGDNVVESLRELVAE